MRILIAFPHHSIQLAEEIEKLFRQGAKARKVPLENVQIALHSDRVMNLLEEEQFTHCVIHDELPKDLDAAPGTGGGFELVARMRAAKFEVPAMLFSNRASWTNVEEILFGALRLIEVRNCETGMEKLVKEIFDSRVPTKHIDITIDLTRDVNGFKYHVDSSEVPVEDQRGSLDLRQDQLEVFEHLSHEIEKNDDWDKTLQKLSNNLTGSLIEAHKGFKGALLLALGKDLANRSRLHFRVEQGQFDVAFETIQHPAGKEYWMLRAPVFRSLKGGADRPWKPIFGDESKRRLSCLIILSQAVGECDFGKEQGKPLGTARYEELAYAAEECTAVEELLTRESEKPDSIQKPVVIGRDRPLTRALLTRTLLSRNWDIVHYIGHTDYREPNGYLLIPGERNSTVDAIGIEEIAPKLEQTRLVYLSSCEGTKFAFVRRLTEQRVPTVFGFRSKVRDDLALEHAQMFYARLFKLSSIEQAFHETKKHFYDTHRKERMWACSSLVMQYN